MQSDLQDRMANPCGQFLVNEYKILDIQYAGLIEREKMLSKMVRNFWITFAVGLLFGTALTFGSPSTFCG